MKKTGSIPAVGLALVLALSSSTAMAFESPHNATVAVDCVDCHQSVNWAWGSGNVDPLCEECHNDPLAPYNSGYGPLVSTHSSANFTSQYGSWIFKCTDCHSPHYQEQRTYKDTVPTELFLATGTVIGTPLHDNGTPGTTDIEVDAINYKSGWTADRLIAKTTTQRYTILMPDQNRPYVNFPVLSIPNSTTITVKGNAQDYISTGTYGIIYGNLIKDTITTPVKFLDNNAFVNGVAAYDGICEVCHTLTDHFQNTGAGADQNHTNVVNATTSNCTTECHLHIYGFAHGNTSQDHSVTGCGTAANCHGLQDSHPTHVGGGSPMITDCTNCHKSGNYELFNDDQLLAGTTVCNNCHSPGGTYDGVSDTAVGAKNNWTDGVYTGSDLTAGKEDWCISCHDETPAHSNADGVSGVDAPNKAGDASTYGYYINGHGRNTTYPATKHGQAGPGYVCLVCHDSTATHLNHALGDDRLRDPSDALVYTDAKSEVCLDCHVYGQSAAGELGYDAVTSATIHSGAITTRYDDSGATTAYPSYGDVADYATKPGYQCVICHDAHGTTKLAMVNSTIDGSVGGTSNPIVVAGFQYNDTTLDDLDPSNAADNGVCDVCHKASGTTTPHPDTNHANNHNWNGLNDDNTGEACVYCHQHDNSFTKGHPREDFAWDATSKVNCGTASCHDWTNNSHVTAQIHNNTCTTCHSTSSGGDGTTINGANARGDARLGSTGRPHTDNCLVCHNSANPGSMHHHLADQTYGSNCTTVCHNGAVTGTASNAHNTRITIGTTYCDDCHTATAGTASTAPVAWNDGKVHDYCVACHTFSSQVGILANKTNSRGLVGTAQLPAGGGQCDLCHDDTPFKDYHHSTDKSQAGSCTSCHTSSLVGPAAPAQMACRECHVDDTQTGVKVLSYRLNLGDGQALTSMVNAGGGGTAGIDASGYVTSHTIAGASTIAIADYEVCMDCHSRTNENGYSNVRNAPVIAPFHGFPGNAATEMIDDGNQTCWDQVNSIDVDCTNKTPLGGGSLVIDEETTAGDDTMYLPLAFQYYHPGFNTFRRFGITQKMTRRSTRNSYADNTRMYDRNPYDIRGDNLSGVKVEDIMRDTNFPGTSDCINGGGGLTIACYDGKADGAGSEHETPETGFTYYNSNPLNIPYTNFGTSLGNLTNVPYFQDNVTATLPDNVYVNSAEVDANGDLQVSAGNDDGCAALSVWADGSTNLGNMGGTWPSCTFTEVGISPIPTTVDVRTSNGLGTDVTGYPVTDNR